MALKTFHLERFDAFEVHPCKVEHHHTTPEVTEYSYDMIDGELTEENKKYDHIVWTVYGHYDSKQSIFGEGLEAICDFPVEFMAVDMAAHLEELRKEAESGG